MINLDAIPGYREAVEQESFIRDSAYVHDEHGKLLTERIGPIEVRSITLHDFVVLGLVKNTFIVGGYPSQSAVFGFLTQLAVPGQSRRIRRFCRRLDALEPIIRLPLLMRCWVRRREKAVIRLLEVTVEIQKYIEEATQDWPPRSSDGRPVNFGIAGSIIGQIARDYGWSQDDILRMPLKCVCQALAEIRLAGGAKIVFNPRSDKVKADWLAKQIRN